MRAHLSLTGNWRNCKSANCRMRFHLPLDATQVGGMPKSVLYGLLEPFDPPSARSDLHNVKQWLDSRRSLHRDYDLPAFISAEGTLAWYQHGMLHRYGDKPAIIRPDGTKEWYWQGRIHRTGMPARVRPDGSEEWYDHGHRWLTDADL